MKKALAFLLCLLIVFGMLAACEKNESNDTEPADEPTPTESSTPETTIPEETLPDDAEDEKALPQQLVTATGTLTNMGVVPDGVYFSFGGILTKYDGNGDNRKTQLLNQNGQVFADVWYDGVYLLVTEGICIVNNTDEDGTELLGIVDTLRERELVPCEAVAIDMLSERFLIVCYKTAPGTKDDRFGQYYIDMETVYYKGYGKVFDLQTGAFVPNIEVSTSAYDVSAAGNMIFVREELINMLAYNANGELLDSYEHLGVYPGSNLIIQTTEAGWNLYDVDMKLVSTLEKTDYSERYSPIDGESEMLLREVLGEAGWSYSVTDLTGKPLTAEYANRLYVNHGCLEIYEDDMCRLLDFDGNVIVPGCKALRYVEPGYFAAEAEDGSCDIYDLTGRKINESPVELLYNSLPAMSENDELLVLETGELIAVTGRPEYQLCGLVFVDNTLYDIVSGDVVLSDVDGCVATGKNLYIWNEESEIYTRFSVEP